MMKVQPKPSPNKKPEYTKDKTDKVVFKENSKLIDLLMD